MMVIDIKIRVYLMHYTYNKITLINVVILSRLKNLFCLRYIIQPLIIFISSQLRHKRKEQIHHRNANNRPSSERNTLNGSNKDCTKTCKKIQ